MCYEFLLYEVEYCESFRPPQLRFFILNSRKDESGNDASVSLIDNYSSILGHGQMKYTKKSTFSMIAIGKRAKTSGGLFKEYHGTK
jgi:hypothetical protein